MFCSSLVVPKLRLDHGRCDAGEGDITSHTQLSDLIQVFYTVFVLQQVSIIDGYLQTIRFTQNLNLERFASLKGEAGQSSLLLPPVVLQHAVAHNHFPVVLIEARVEVEGNILALNQVHL